MFKARTFAALALSALALPTGADLEAPEGVTGPYVPVSAWAVAPAMDRPEVARYPWEPAPAHALPETTLALEPSPPLVMMLPLSIACAMEGRGLVSFEPHADLAWAHVPRPVERPTRMITFMGEGQEPHGTLDFAGHSPSTGTIPAE